MPSSKNDRRPWFTRLALVLLLSACGGPSGSKVEPAAPSGDVPMCDRGGIEKGLEALDTIEPSMRQELAAAMVAEACRLPEGLRTALADVAQSGQCLGAARGIASAPVLLYAACVGGARSVAKIAESGEPGATLVDECELERLGIATRAELVRGGHWACQLLGAMTFVALRDAGEPSAKAVGRALMLE